MNEIEKWERAWATYIEGLQQNDEAPQSTKARRTIFRGIRQLCEIDYDWTRQLVGDVWAFRAATAGRTYE